MESVELDTKNSNEQHFVKNEMCPHCYGKMISYYNPVKVSICNICSFEAEITSATKQSSGINTTPDIELLKLAAKAAGIAAEYHYGCGEALCLIQPAESLYWNPLRSDANAFKLASTLLLTVVHTDKSVIVKNDKYYKEWVIEELNQDRNTLARRGIVSAAAAIADIVK